MNIVTVKINGVEYNLKGEEQEEYLHKVASYVDKKVRSVLENNKKLSTSSAAVLSAVNIVDDMFKIHRDYEELVKISEELEKKRIDYEEQVESLKKQLKHMEEYNSELQLKLKNVDADDAEMREEEIKSLKREMEIMKETTQKYMKENSELKSQNKEFKFQIQSDRYKIIDLLNKLQENQINLVKEKKQRYPLLKDKIK